MGFADGRPDASGRKGQARTPVLHPPLQCDDGSEPGFALRLTAGVSPYDPYRRGFALHSPKVSRLEMTQNLSPVNFGNLIPDGSPAVQQPHLIRPKPQASRAEFRG